jgi:hypothetical protein
MIRKFTVIILFTAFFSHAFSQESTPTAPKKTVRPDIPGTFVLELGINGAPQAPDRFDLGFWGSRTFNVYYQYDLRIAKSKFSVVPGLGLSLERFKFRNGYTLMYQTGSTDPKNDTLAMFSPSQAGLPGMKKSQLVTNYVELPLEICFRTNPDDPARSFKASIGGRVGFLYDSFTKVKYKEGSEVKQFKDKQRFELNQFRYGVYTKIGFGNFSIFGYYNINTLFEEGGGPVEMKKKTEFNTFTAGISLSSF